MSASVSGGEVREPFFIVRVHREVKPGCADGTVSDDGRVGSCPYSKGCPRSESDDSSHCGDVSLGGQWGRGRRAMGLMGPMRLMRRRGITSVTIRVTSLSPATACRRTPAPCQRVVGRASVLHAFHPRFHGVHYRKRPGALLLTDFLFRSPAAPVVLFLYI